MRPRTSSPAARDHNVRPPRPRHNSYRVRKPGQHGTRHHQTLQPRSHQGKDRNSSMTWNSAKWHWVLPGQSRMSAAWVISRSAASSSPAMLSPSLLRRTPVTGSAYGSSAAYGRRYRATVLRYNSDQAEVLLGRRAARR